jgi:hypothetical protein
VKHWLVVIVLMGATVSMHAAVTDAYQDGLNLYRAVWSHLNHAQQRIASNPGDWYRFDVARGQMELLERTWKSGSCDRSQMDDAIFDVGLVVDNNNISPGDRKLLLNDMEKLRVNRVKYCH